MKKFFFQLIGLAIISTLIVGCQSSTEKSMCYADTLEESLEKFDDISTELSDDVQKIVSETDECIKGKEVALEEIAENWEVEWGNIENKAEEVEQKYTNIVIDGDEFFNEIFRNILLMSNPAIRESDSLMTVHIRSKWISEVNNTGKVIFKMRNMVEDGSDIELCLRNSALRGKIFNKMKELEQISEEASVVFKQLQKFSINGKSIFSNLQY